MGATVIEFRFFNRIMKKKKKKKKITLRFCENYIYEYLTHTASNYIKIFVGVNFMVIFTLMLLDVELN